MKKIFVSILIVIIFCSCTKSTEKKTEFQQKIIVLSPEVVEIICAIEGEDKICAVTRECDFPTSLNEKTKVGSFSKPNIEKILSLQADMVFTSGLEQDLIKSQLEKIGTRVQQFYPSNLDSLMNAIQRIGKLIDKQENANKLIKKFTCELRQIDERTHKPEIYVEIYNNPLMTVSSESFIGDLVAKSGGKNAFSSLPRDYCRVSAEKIVQKNPDIILILSPGISKEDVSERLGWENIKAIKNSHIYTDEEIDIDTFLRAGPRALQAIKTLNTIIDSWYEK